MESRPPRTHYFKWRSVFTPQEKYPPPATENALQNRQAPQKIFPFQKYRPPIAGWSPITFNLKKKGLRLLISVLMSTLQSFFNYEMELRMRKGKPLF